MKHRVEYQSAAQRYGDALAADATFFREIAFAVDSNPEEITKYYDHSAVGKFTKDRKSSCLERTKVFEAGAYGDAGVLLASPGPSLSGLMLRELGTVAQQELFFDYVESTKARTFLAVTEPNHGSDANNMCTFLLPDRSSTDHYLLKGEKCLVGNGACASIGVVIARTSLNPLGINAVLLTPDMLQVDSTVVNDHLVRKPLPTFGLAGAQLAQLIFNEYPIEKKCLLGQHLSAVNRGMLAVIKTFNRMRPSVAALALGLAQAVLDYIYMERVQFNSHEESLFIRLTTLVNTARHLLHMAAATIDSNPLATVTASLAKVKATAVAETVTTQCWQFFGKGAFYEHPWLAKWYRDSFGFEYMEGTTNIHKKNICQEYINGRLQ